tara:strand:+ start:116706 stop:117524 length:819 start_codon:yes stop_codon:yes gene_type:complete
MKKLLLGIMGASLLSLGGFAQTTYSVGELVNDFTVTDTDGNEHNLYDITASGKHVYLDFFFDTCPPCQATSPIFGEFYDKYGCNSGDVYCLVMNNGTDNDAEVMAYEAAYGGPGHHAPAVSSEGGAGAVNSDFGVGAFPTYVLIGEDNRIIEQDIYPIADITTFEGTFYDGFEPDPMPCSFAGVEDNTLEALSIYPNPANELATVQFSSETESEASITIYNMLGEVVDATIVNVVAGNNLQEVCVADYETGSYIVQIQLGEAIITSKLEVIK